MDISETIKFRDICVMFDKVKKAKLLADKEKYLRRYYDSFQKHRISYRQANGLEQTTPESGNSSFYCILRCILPGTDNARSAYRMQITTLAKVYIKVLQLAPDSPDAQRLHARSYSGVHGDYANIVYSVLLPRCSQTPSDLSLKQVHEMLDTIATDDRRNTEKVLTRLSESASVREQMWFIRLLLKGMHLGIGEQRVLAILHPQAKELYQRCSNLSRVCCLLADDKLTEPSDDKSAPSRELNVNEAICPFQHIRPMLCEIYPGNIEALMASDVLYVETKMDGERFQLHFNNGQFMYISRNGINYTNNFGENYDSGRLTPLLMDLLPVGMQSIILDGEMMVWDTVSARFREKGENTDVKHLGRHPNWRPCFIAYDLLYLNGNSLLDMSYAKRTHKLREIIKEQPGVLQWMKPRKVASMTDFKSIFQEALDTNQEGIVIKKQNSVYKPGVRNGGGWFKVKADYIDGLTKEFDLLIIGGFYNRKRTFIESFLMGVLRYKSPQEFEVYSVGKVSNCTRQRVVLNETLKQFWHQVTSDPPPMWYHYSNRNAEGRPDVWIEPLNSCILEIKATDLVPSAAFVMARSLHFPRIVAWRNDKSWSECLSVKDYLQMIQGTNGIKKINKREVRMEDLTAERKRMKLTPAMKRKLGLLAYERKFNVSEVERESNFLTGFSFCVLSAALKNGCTPEKLKALVMTNGGEIVENPIEKDPNCIAVAGDLTFRVKAMIKSKRFSIVSVDWLQKICAQQYMQLKPNDMICLTDELQSQFAELYDACGDSYTEPTDAEELKVVLNCIPEEKYTAVHLTKDEVGKLEKKLFQLNTPNFFRNCLAYFYNSEDQRIQLAELVFRWRGGSIYQLSDTEHIANVKYIFINTKKFDKLIFLPWLQSSFIAHLSSLQIVNIDWILDSHAAASTLNVCEYTWHDF